MFKIKTLNKIAPAALQQLPAELYQVVPEEPNPDAIIVRSFDMLAMDLPENLKVIARAGAGYNNIPVDRCTTRGIAVFNTPGANANGVKELVFAGMFLSCRKIYNGIAWAKTLIGKGEEVPKLIESGKSQFEGPEIKSKTLGVLGLGAIGLLVANDAVALGMRVIGFDPYLAPENAAKLSPKVEHVSNLQELLRQADFISLHLPLVDATKKSINQEKFQMMKKGVRLLNFSRNAVVNNNDLKQAVEDGIVACYVTDFPDEELLKIDQVIGIPHLGASTPESEDNCAFMAAEQIRGFLERGALKNCVNLPTVEMTISGAARLVVIGKKDAGISNTLRTLLENELNIQNSTELAKGEVSYLLFDLDKRLSAELIDRVKSIPGVSSARVITF